MARSFEPSAEGIAALTPYWTSILGARSQGGSRTDAWAAVQEGFQAGGASPIGATIFDMNEMWRRVGEVILAQDAFGAAEVGQAVTNEMWSWAPWATPDTAAWQTPNYMLNYTVQAVDAEGNLLVDDEGEPIPVYGATDWQGSIDVTTADVIDRVLGSAQSALDTGSPGTRNQLSGLGATGLGEVLSVQILRF